MIFFVICVNSYCALEIQSITNDTLKPANCKELELFVPQDKIDKLKLITFINEQEEHQIGTRLDPIIGNQGNGDEEPERECS